MSDGLNEGTEIGFWEVLGLLKKSVVRLGPSAVILVQFIAINGLAQRQTHWRQFEDR